MSNEHFTILDGGLSWTGDGETITVEAWGDNSLRVRGAMKSPILDNRFALLDPAPTEPTIVIDGPVATLTNGDITARLVSETAMDVTADYVVHRCSITFLDREGAVLLEEIEREGSLKLRARAYRGLPGGNHELTVAFKAAPEHLAGMGQYQQDILDLKGTTFELAHRNSQASVPFVMSSRGYGFLWHNPAIGRATFGSNRTEWVAGSTRQLDYWITAGSSPSAISTAYAKATGFVPMMPEYGLGFWQCKLRYRSQEELLAVAREHIARGIPLDVIVADFFHWPLMGDYRFEEEFWPDPIAMIDELRELGVELMVSVWPQVSQQSENFVEFSKRNALITSERGMGPQMGFEGSSRFVDTLATSGRELLWEICKRNYFDLGVRLFWLDEAEPEFGVYDFDNYRYETGSSAEVGNLYPQQFSRAFFEGQQAAGQEGIVNLVRCAWAGSQRYGALVWSGDISSTWDDFRRQLTAAIHMGVAGLPWFTTDIGGFHNGDPRDEEFRELLIRWFQFGTFCPVMRLHGFRQPEELIFAQDGSHRSPTGAANELWSFGDDAYPTLVRYVHLREKLRPYVRAEMERAHTTGEPLIRGLFYDFPDDERAWGIADQYLFGPDLLVAPVVELGARSRDVYLPLGANWVDLATGTSHPGGTTITVAAPLEVIPVFARNGTHPELVGG